MPSSINIHNPTSSVNKDKIFIIYAAARKQKILTLKKKRFKNKPMILYHNFSGGKEIR